MKFSLVVHETTLFDSKGNKSFMACETLQEIVGSVNVYICCESNEERIKSEYDGAYTELWDSSRTETFLEEVEDKRSVVIFGPLGFVRKGSKQGTYSALYYFNREGTTTAQEMIRDKWLPDFSIVSFYTLKSVFTHTLTVDHKRR